MTSREADPNTSNNSATAKTTVDPRTDLLIVKNDSIDPVLVGETVSYTVTVTDNGPSDATGVTVTDTLPGTVDFVSATPTKGTCNEAAGTVTCEIGTLANAAQASITIVVRTTTDGSLTNSVSVTGTETDPNSSNNAASEDTTVSPVSDLSLTKTGSPAPAQVNEELTYTIVVTNQGPSRATEVTAKILQVIRSK